MEMTIVKHNAALNGFNRLTINGAASSTETMRPEFTLSQGQHYRVKIRNGSDDVHPVHLHRHSFELVGTGGNSTADILKMS